MSAKQIEKRIVSCIAAQFGMKKTDVKLDHHLAKDLHADSLDEVELVMFLEDEFEIDISEKHARQIKTVGQAVAYVIGRLGVKP